jgi:hypothetical protein
MIELSRPTAVRGADDLWEASRAIADELDSVFECLDLIGDQLVEIHRSALDRHEDFTAEHLVKLRPVILEQLRRRSFVDGLGILTASDLVAGRARCIEWWRQDVDNVAPLWLNLDPTSVDIYDYLEMEWFTKAQRQNARSVFGPYVDYSGSDHYILTFATPVIDTAFIGVVGADVLMSLFEARILPVLYGLNRDVVLVNDERRVVSANSERWTVSSRLPAMPVASQRGFDGVVEVGADSGWVLASASTLN